MPGSESIQREEFLFRGPAEDPADAGTWVRILVGNILEFPNDIEIDAVVSTDDNYLTMASGYSRTLRKHTLSDPSLGGDPEYIREAQKVCPVEAGTVVATDAYGLKDLLGVTKVLHGAVIDYDAEMDDARKKELVERTTANCLRVAEEQGMRSILFPAFATGAAEVDMADCAGAMCQAIKSYLALDRQLREIYIILYDQDPPEKHLAFIREVKLILGVPYDPERDRRQIRDFFGRDRVVEELERIITGEQDSGGKKRHAVILGGPSAGKRAILDQIYRRAKLPGSRLSEGRRVVRLTFGAVHRKTPMTFVYRKFYHALAKDLRKHGLRDTEGKPLDTGCQLLEEKLAVLYADSGKATKKDFLNFLKDHKEYYPEVVFLVDKLPRLLQGEDESPEDETSIRHFWEDLDDLQECVRFAYTARPDEEYETLKDERFAAAKEFRKQIKEVFIPCVSEEARRKWIGELFKGYLGSDGGVPTWADRFLEREAGRHPYLLSFLGCILVRRLKEKLLGHPDWELDSLDTLATDQLCEETLWEAEEPRRAFFERLINFLRTSKDWREFRSELEALARAVALEEGKESLMQFLIVGDPNAVTERAELEKEGDPRLLLDPAWLAKLYNLGYLVGTETATEGQQITKEDAQFMSDSFAAYVLGILVGRVGPRDQPADVTISILASKRGWMRTVFRGRGAKAIEANQPLGKSDRERFMKSFRNYINLRFPQVSKDAPGASLFDDTEQIGKHILTQFATLRIRRYLWSAPRHSSVVFMIDEDLADLPWELMLEATYAGEIPFRVGRIIISEQDPQSVLPPVRGIGKVRALLIGNPSGDPNLTAAEEEVRWLRETLVSEDHGDLFEEPTVLIGSEQCQSIRLLNELSSGRFGLVHYSGHALFRGSDSAWVVGDGELSTHQLTKAIQSGPPVMVICSACRSAEAGAAHAPRYEGQSFDLPGAFLQAGVEAYIGAMWPVDSIRSGEFVKQFYAEFLKGKYSIGECLRLAKWARKQEEESIFLVPEPHLAQPKEGTKLPTPIDWLAFVLYGDPRVTPGDLFSAMANPQQWAL